jgi:hypothetical protein
LGGLERYGLLKSRVFARARLEQSKTVLFAKPSELSEKMK